MSSGLPFNPMRKSPPPPPHTDTVSFNPAEYVAVRSCDDREFFVHGDCLRVAPLLRRAFGKRQDISRAELVLSFAREGAPGSAYNGDGDSEYRDSAYTEEETHGDVDMEAVSADMRPSSEVTIVSPVKGSTPPILGRERTTSLPFSAATDGDAPLLSPATVRTHRSNAPPLVLTETLHIDDTAALFFPTTSGATLEIILAYLHYKYRYDRLPHDPRPPFVVPPESAIEVMRLASMLEC